MATKESAGPDTREVEGRILTFIRRELLSPEAAVGPHDDLLSDLLDSVAVLRLVAFVDEEFEITTRPGDFVIENFQTVAALGQYVRRAARRPADPPPDSGR